MLGNIKGIIDRARDILVGMVPDPKGQIDQITNALIYKFMDDSDQEIKKIPGGKATFFVGGLEKHAWHKLFDPKLNNEQREKLYTEGIVKLSKAESLPTIFRNIFKDAIVTFRASDTMDLFLNQINEFPPYENNSEDLGAAFEYLLYFMGTQGKAGQFRTPPHIIDFIVDVVAPQKSDIILDPACGTAGFLVSSYKHIINNPEPLTQREKVKLADNINGIDLDPQMVKLARVNLYLHGFKEPKINQNDTLSNEKLWDSIYPHVILANPPFMTPTGGIRPHDKFTTNATRAELLFVDYIGENLRHNGRAGVIVPEGIVFQAANAYKELRKKLIDDWGLYAVASLPSGVFNPYSGVKTSILFMDKGFSSKSILFVKIENDGYDLGAKRRKINKNDLPHALKIIQQWKQTKRISAKGKALAHSVSKKEIAEDEEYNLTGDRYRKVENYNDANYPMVKLDEIIELNFGTRVTKKNDQGSKYPVYGGGGESFRVDNFNRENELIISRFAMSEKCVRYVKGKFFLLDSGFSYSIKPTTGKVTKNFVDRIFLSIQQQILQLARGHAQKNLDIKKFKEIKIPLPSLEMQEKIVAEIDVYQKVIDGAKQVITSWKPQIKINTNCPMVEIGKICSFEYGKSLKEEDRKKGEYPVFGSNGVVGYHNKFLAKGPFIIVGRKGSAGAINWSEKNGFPIDTTFYVQLRDETKTELKYLFYVMSALKLRGMNVQTGVPGLNRNDAYKVKIPLPSLKIQKQIVAEIETEQQVINQCKTLIEKMEKKIADKISEVWA